MSAEDAGQEAYHLLGYEQQIVQEMLEQDALCIMAAGLGWHRVIAAMLKMHDNAASGVILIIGATVWQRQLICAELSRSDPSLAPPTDINNEVPAWQRTQLYDAGTSSNDAAQQQQQQQQDTDAAASGDQAAAAAGSSSSSSRKCAACFVTTRILVVDILSQRIKPSQIAGLVILNAHRVTDNSGEGFAVRLYRQGSGLGVNTGQGLSSGNDEGFVRAFSDNPNAFAAGFNRVEKVMKALHVRRLMLFPRFHVSVKDSLETRPPEFSEWECDPSPAQLALLEAVREVLTALVKDLGRSNPKLDLSDIQSLAADPSLSRPLDRAVRQQLEPIWHTLNWRSRTAIKDLASVQGLIPQLMSYDAVTFLSHLEGVRLSEAGSSIWIYHEATHVIFEQARRRVYNIVYPGGQVLQQQQQGGSSTAAGSRKQGRAAAGRGSSSSRATKAAKSRNGETAAAAAAASVAADLAAIGGGTGGGPAAATAAGPKIEPILEAPPKWELLIELLDEIQTVKRNTSEQARTAVVISDAEQQQQKGLLQEQQQDQQQNQGLQQRQQGQQQQQIQQQQQGVEIVDLLDSSDHEDDQTPKVETTMTSSTHQQQPSAAAAAGQRLTAAAVAALAAAAAAPVLIVCKETHTLRQLQRVVSSDPRSVMKQQFQAYLMGQLAAAEGRNSSSMGRGRGSRGGRGRGRGRQQHQGSNAAVTPAAAAAAAAGSSGRGRGRGFDGPQRFRDRIWAGRGPALAAAERTALLAAAREMQQQNNLPTQDHDLGNGAADSAAAAADAAATGRGRVSKSRGRGRGRGRAVKQQQRGQQQRRLVDSDNDWQASSEEADHHEQQQQQPVLQQQQQQLHESQQNQQHAVHFYSLDSQDPAVLCRVKPGFIIMYDADVAFLRLIELYQAEWSLVHPDAPPVQVYQAYYAAAPEKESFMAAVTRESSMFGDLIRAKQHLVLPVDMGHDTLKQLLPPLRDQLQSLQQQQQYRPRNALAPGPHNPNTSNPNDLWLDVYSANALSRVGGLSRRLKPVPCQLVVDVREFMSELPAVLHQQGFKLTPVTLEVGDYVLSPEIVVERKALPDLFSSLGSGRLYHQAEAMTKSYKTPILLIEFDGDKAFALTGLSELSDSGGLDHRSPQARLVLLLLHFPKLRLLWSRSQHATGELFLTLKRNQEEPDAAAAALVGLPLDVAAATAAAGPAAAGPGGQGGATLAAAGGSSQPPVISSDMVSQSPAVASLIASQAQAAQSSQDSVVNQAAIDVLRRLPVITDSNWRSVINGCGSLKDLCGMDEDQLEVLLGSSRNAKALHAFLHAPCPVAQSAGMGLGG